MRFTFVFTSRGFFGFVVFFVAIDASLERAKQLSRRHLQRSRELYNVEDCRIPFATLDHADVVPVEPCGFGKCFLRHLSRGPQLTYRAAESR